MRFATPLDLAGCEMALDRLQLPVSWPNVNSLNNTFSYQWVDGKTYQVILNAPSEQTIAGIAQYLQLVMFNNGHYIINTATGAITYYLSLAFNQNLYRTTIG